MDTQQINKHPLIHHSREDDDDEGNDSRLLLPLLLLPHSGGRSCRRGGGGRGPDGGTHIQPLPSPSGSSRLPSRGPRQLAPAWPPARNGASSPPP